MAIFRQNATQQKNENAVSDPKTLERLAGQVIVVKLGGNAVSNEAVLASLLDDVVVLVQSGARVLVVHGGGTRVTDELAAVGKETKKVEGLRVTDDQTLAIAVSVFNAINEELAEKLRLKGANALSFCAKSAIPFVAEKMKLKGVGSAEIDLGWVGQIASVDSGCLENWLWAGWIPVISPLGTDVNGHYYNLNADHAALAIAAKLRADALVFLTDVPGVLQELSDPSSRITHVTCSDAQQLIECGTISGGMLPKLKSCISGIASGIDKISIVNSFEAHALISGVLTPQSVGTLITGDLCHV